MLVDLVRAQTTDGCTLDGAFQRADPSCRATLPLDAVCLIHGTGSNFYQSTMLEYLAQQFLEEGVSVLRANTRGHDGISTLVSSRGGTRMGAAHEFVDDCRHDLLAWARFLWGHAGSRIALVGHSLGAVKCLYAAAHEPALWPTMIGAISPPRLSYEWFCNSPRAEEFLDTYRRAEALVEKGKGNTLLGATVPLPMVISAAGFAEKYGPQDRYNFLPLLRQISCPIAFVFGSQEVETNVAFAELPDELSWRGEG